MTDPERAWPTEGETPLFFAIIDPKEPPLPENPTSDSVGASMDFSNALLEVKAGGRITRETWNAPGQWVELQVPDEHSKMQRPYLFLSPADGALVPWVPTQSDLLAHDWVAIGKG